MVAASAGRQDVIHRHLAEAALTGLELKDRVAQVLRPVVGPVDILEDQLRVSAFPQEEVRQPPLIAGAHDSSRILGAAAGEVES